MDNAASINVAVRIRPLTEWEAARLPTPLDSTRQFFGDGHLTAQPRTANFGQFRKIIAYEEDGSVIYDPMDPQAEAIYRQKGYLPPGTYRYKHKKYQYDHVFGPDASQKDVYERTTKPLLDGIFDGYNATVFAYGATGCGKTHTISGTAEDPGVIYATMAELFQRIEERRDDYSVDVSLSFLEIYNEEIRDLLAPAGSETPRGGLAMREDKSNRVTVAGLTELVPTSADEVNTFVQAGNARRTQSPTHANATSSRSHAVLQINVTQSPRTASVTEERTMATLSIIDLAGSERASATKNMGKRMVEGANINKSLLALGNCINALCEARTRIHIPYRNSKLTRLLKFSLGGNCRTVMIVCVAPTSAHLEDTGNSLAYANRAKEIKTKVSKNIMDVDRHVGQYVEAINRLNDEVRELKAKLAGEIAVENEGVRRRRLNAAKAVEATRMEIRELVAKSKTMLCNASFTAGNTAASNAKLEAIRQRLKELDIEGELTSDGATEKGLLNVIVSTEEAVIQKEADTIARASATESLFITNVGLARKRKGDDWDESAPALLQMEGDLALAEMRALRAEKERDGLKAALAGQSKLVTSLIGMLARTNVLVGDAARLLKPSSETTLSSEEVASKLEFITTGNDQLFRDVLGTSIKAVTTSGKGGFANLTAPAPTKKRTSVTATPIAVRPRHSGNRRSSIGGMGSPGRRGVKSPRKPSSFRQSSGNRKVQEKKSVRWEVPVKPDESYIAPTTPTRSRPKMDLPPATILESEWEDDRAEDRNDDSSRVDNASGNSLSLDAVALSFSTISAPQPATTSIAPPPRRSKMDPDFLNPKTDVVTERDDATSKRTVLGDLNRATNKTPTSSSKTRRRSNVGPVRHDRKGRRSSLIPQLSPNYKSASDTSTSSVKKSPKKPKRTSLLGALTSSKMRPSLLKFSGDTSINLSSKPSWK